MHKYDKREFGRQQVTKILTYKDLTWLEKEKERLRNKSIRSCICKIDTMAGDRFTLVALIRGEGDDMASHIEEAIPLKQDQIERFKQGPPIKLSGMRVL